MAPRPVAVVLVPVKPRRVAKSRLRGAFGDATDDVVLAMATDVASAALGCGDVAEVIVITDDPGVRMSCEELGATVIPDPVGAGLNGALRHAASIVSASHAAPVIVCQPADCPCALPEDFAALIAHANSNSQPVFVPDTTGTGTSSLAFGPGAPFDPRYGPHSAARHLEAGAAALRGDPWRRLSRDVDTAADLPAALALGVGRKTRAWAAAVGLTPLSPT